MNEDFVLQCIRQTPDNKNGIALDIGANHGMYTILLARKFGHVYAFEPHPFNVVFLKRNIGNRDNVTVVETALSNSIGTTKFYVNHYNPGGHTINPNVAATGLWGHDTETFIEVPTQTLDAFYDDFKLVSPYREQKFNLIKCDVEGAEDFLFEGAKNFLTNESPRIILEVHQRVNLVNLYDYFINLGYNFVDENFEQAKALGHDKHYLISKVTL